MVIMLINCKKEQHIYGNIGYRVNTAYYNTIYRNAGLITYIGIFCNNYQLFYHADAVSRWYIYVD